MFAKKKKSMRGICVDREVYREIYPWCSKQKKFQDIIYNLIPEFFSNLTYESNKILASHWILLCIYGRSSNLHRNILFSERNLLNSTWRIKREHMQSMSSRSLEPNGDNRLAQEVWRTEPAKLNYRVNFLNMSVGFRHTGTCTFLKNKAKLQSLCVAPIS